MSFLNALCLIHIFHRYKYDDTPPFASFKRIIDVSRNVGRYADALADAGVECVIRYYDNNTTDHKHLTGTESQQLFAAGLDVAVVFEQHGGKDGRIEDFGTENGTRDAKSALNQAHALGQPQGSAIYFGVDFDFVHPNELQEIRAYFQQAAQLVRQAGYQIGVYGSGKVSKFLRAAGLVDYVWLAGATGWSGTKAAFAGGEYDLFQSAMEQKASNGLASIEYDGNITNPGKPNFGQFNANGIIAENRKGLGAHAIYEINARSGLVLRSGPGTEFREIQTYPKGKLVSVIGRSNEWLKVDIDGDGSADGFMHEHYLLLISGGLPLERHEVEAYAKTQASQGIGRLRPIDIAYAELAHGVKEFPGTATNPRIAMYHATTKGGAAADQVAWCSSFVNYCVEQAGLTGTDHKMTRSWDNWGTKVEVAEAREGDIVVFGYNGTPFGHVAFYIEGDAR